jgi:hypothetical protein
MVIETIKEKNMTDYFILKGTTPKLAELTTVSERKDGNVHFANAWGGFVSFTTEAQFAEQFEKLPEKTVTKLIETCERISVTALEGAASMEGFTNGQTWNGWEVPMFTKETVLEALKEGGHLANPIILEFTRFLFDKNTNDLYEITVPGGNNIPDDFDISVLEQFFAEPRDRKEVAAFEETIGLWISVTPKKAINAEGETEPKVVYEIGNGWCWENMARFENEAKASTGPKM